MSLTGKDYFTKFEKEQKRHEKKLENFVPYWLKAGSLNPEERGKLLSGCRIPIMMGGVFSHGRSSFPMAGEKEGVDRIVWNLKAKIDEELIEAYRGTVSIPLETGDNKKIAVKIVDDRGKERLKILEVK